MPLRVVVLVGARQRRRPVRAHLRGAADDPAVARGDHQRDGAAVQRGVRRAVAGQRFSRRLVAGLALGLLGVALVVGLAPVDLDAKTLLAVAASTARGRLLRGRRPPAQAPLRGRLRRSPPPSSQQLAAGRAARRRCCSPTRRARRPDAGQIACVVALAVGASGIGYLIYFRLIAELGATSAMTVTYLVPVFGVLWAALFRGDEITVGMLVGAAVVLAGIALVTGASSRGSGGPSDPAPPSPSDGAPPPPAPTGAAAGRS